jgi:hypothetical protein
MPLQTSSVSAKGEEIPNAEVDMIHATSGARARRKHLHRHSRALRPVSMRIGGAA